MSALPICCEFPVADDDRSGDERRLTDNEMERFERYLVRPLADRFERFEREMHIQLIGMRTDFRDALEQNRAILSTITNLESGYVPRSEHALTVNELRKEDRAVNTRLDAQLRWIIGTGVAIAGLGVTLLGKH